MSSIYNILELPIRRNGRKVGLQSCFNVFSLKAGCRMIAVFEAIISAMQIYLTREQYEEFPQTSEKLENLMLTQKPVVLHTNVPPFVNNPNFSNAIDCLVLLNSVILIVGSELANIPSLIIWLCITILCKSVDVIIHILQGNDLTSLFFLCTTLIIKLYFCFVVISLILKLRDKLFGSLTETEVLYTQAEEV